METRQQETWKKQVESLTGDQQQLLKDIINFGSWGDGEETFLSQDGKPETDGMYGYLTNEAKKAGHFHGRQISGLVSSICQKLCPKGAGRFFSHCSDWWGDGNGDMLFIRYNLSDEVEQWAKNNY